MPKLENYLGSCRAHADKMDLGPELPKEVQLILRAVYNKKVGGRSTGSLMRIINNFKGQFLSPDTLEDLFKQNEERVPAQRVYSRAEYVAPEPRDPEDPSDTEEPRVTYEWYNVRKVLNINVPYTSLTHRQAYRVWRIYRTIFNNEDVTSFEVHIRRPGGSGIYMRSGAIDCIYGEGFPSTEDRLSSCQRELLTSLGTFEFSDHRIDLTMRPESLLPQIPDPTVVAPNTPTGTGTLRLEELVRARDAIRGHESTTTIFEDVDSTADLQVSIGHADEMVGLIAPDEPVRENDIRTLEDFRNPNGRFDNETDLWGAAEYGLIPNTVVVYLETALQSITAAVFYEDHPEYGMHFCVRSAQPLEVRRQRNGARRDAFLALGEVTIIENPNLTKYIITKR